MSGGAARVLEALRRADGRPCSGEALSAELAVSRSQVWKHVETLRQRGYGIEGEAGGGYRLVALPDRLFPEEVQAGLATRWLARELVHLDSTDSTNRVAQERARAGAPHGTTVIAEGQTAGRGRLGRSFHSPPYLNLYASIVLRPSLTTAEAPSLILAAGVGVAEAVARAVPDPAAVEIKWPNDVLLGGLKTSGILMEMSAEATQVAFLVLGIGVNLNVAREQFPEEFQARATSLAAHCGRAVDRCAFARSLFGILEEVLDVHAERGFRALRPRFDRFFRMAGRRIRVAEVGGAEFDATAEDVDEDGSLRVRLDGGELRNVVAGDVTLLKTGVAA